MGFLATCKKKFKHNSPFLSVWTMCLNKQRKSHCEQEYKRTNTQRWHSENQKAEFSSTRYLAYPAWFFFSKNVLFANILSSEC